MRVLNIFIEQGYNLLLPDLRGHGQSEGDYIAMGWLDRLDIINWIKYLIDNDSKVKIILYGVSMGAANSNECNRGKIACQCYCCY